MSSRPVSIGAKMFRSLLEGQPIDRLYTLLLEISKWVIAKNLDFFELVEKDDLLLVNVLRHSEFCRWQKDTVVYREGDRSPHTCYIILSGQCRLILSSGSTVSLLSTGSCFGQAFLENDDEASLDAPKRKCTVKAAGDGLECLVIHRDDFQRVLSIPDRVDWENVRPYAAFLHRSIYFQDWPEERLLTLISMMQEHHLEEGDVLVRHKMKLDRVFIVKEGLLSRICPGQNGYCQVLIRQQGPLSVIGGGTAFGHYKATSDARAAVKSTIFSVDSVLFGQMLLGMKADTNTVSLLQEEEASETQFFRIWLDHPDRGEATANLMDLSLQARDIFRCARCGANGHVEFEGDCDAVDTPRPQTSGKLEESIQVRETTLELFVEPGPALESPKAAPPSRPALLDMIMTGEPARPRSSSGGLKLPGMTAAKKRKRRLGGVLRSSTGIAGGQDKLCRWSPAKQSLIGERRTQSEHHVSGSQEICLVDPTKRNAPQADASDFSLAYESVNGEDDREQSITYSEESTNRGRQKEGEIRVAKTVKGRGRSTELQQEARKSPSPARRLKRFRKRPPKLNVELPDRPRSVAGQSSPNSRSAGRTPRTARSLSPSTSRSLNSANKDSPASGKKVARESPSPRRRSRRRGQSFDAAESTSARRRETEPRSPLFAYDEADEASESHSRSTSPMLASTARIQSKTLPGKKQAIFRGSRSREQSPNRPPQKRQRAGSSPLTLPGPRRDRSTSSTRSPIGGTVFFSSSLRSLTEVRGRSPSVPRTDISDCEDDEGEVGPYIFPSPNYKSPHRRLRHSEGDDTDGLCSPDRISGSSFQSDVRSRTDSSHSRSPHMPSKSLRQLPARSSPSSSGQLRASVSPSSSAHSIAVRNALMNIHAGEKRAGKLAPLPKSPALSSPGSNPGSNSSKGSKASKGSPAAPGLQSMAPLPSVTTLTLGEKRSQRLSLPTGSPKHEESSSPLERPRANSEGARDLAKKGVFLEKKALPSPVTTLHAFPSPSSRDPSTAPSSEISEAFSAPEKSSRVRESLDTSDTIDVDLFGNFPCAPNSTRQQARAPRRERMLSTVRDRSRGWTAPPSPSQVARNATTQSDTALQDEGLEAKAGLFANHSFRDPDSIRGTLFAAVHGLHPPTPDAGVTKSLLAALDDPLLPGGL